MKTFSRIFVIEAPRDLVWHAVTDSEQFERWSGQKAEVNELPHHQFKLFNGQVRGKNLEVEQHKKLVQEWQSANWTFPSTLTMLFSDDPTGATRIDVTQENIPNEEYEEIEKGWQNIYFDPLAKYLERRG